MSNVQLSKAAVNRRETAPPVCYDYWNTYTKSHGSWWDAWKPSSTCLWTGKSNDGGSAALAYGTSLAISETFRIKWTLIEKILEANLGLSVTETYTKTDTKTCTVKAYSVVQVWTAQYLAWGWFWTQECNSCYGCQPEYVNGGITTPAKSPGGNHVELGCSTGSKNVKC